MVPGEAQAPQPESLPKDLQTAPCPQELQAQACGNGHHWPQPHLQGRLGCTHCSHTEVGRPLHPASGPIPVTPAAGPGCVLKGQPGRWEWARRSLGPLEEGFPEDRTQCCRCRRKVLCPMVRDPQHPNKSILGNVSLPSEKHRNTALAPQSPGPPVVQPGHAGAT